MDRAAFNAREFRKYYEEKNKGQDYKMFDPSEAVLAILKDDGSVLKREEIIEKLLPKAGLAPSDRDLAGEFVTEALGDLVKKKLITRVEHGYYKANPDEK